MNEHFRELCELVDYAMDTQTKRHIIGGVLLSVSLLFGGLAFTVMSLKNDEEQYDEQRNGSTSSK